MLGNGHVRFGGRPRGKGPTSKTVGTSPRGPSCPGRERSDRARRAPGPQMDLVAALDADRDARPRPARRDRTVPRPATRADRVDLQRDRPPAQPAGHRPRPPPRPHPRLDSLATTPPTPSPNQPLPDPARDMITIYGCSTRQLRDQPPPTRRRLEHRPSLPRHRPPPPTSRRPAHITATSTMSRPCVHPVRSGFSAPGSWPGGDRARQRSAIPQPVVSPTSRFRPGRSRRARQVRVRG